jgi:hypothetical protein
MEYLKENAILVCSCGLLPSLLEVTSNNVVKLQGGKMATIRDNIADENIKSFMVCSIAKICQLDKSLKKTPLPWLADVTTVKAEEHTTLLDSSKLICPVGGVISCLMSGQF